ncbi:MAG: hypothetical protein P4L53_23880 [Candidatus Obscuribacterales bacterium]|nr:hypothetical protein [Candidatus Obscuribacterales bacterium]
MSNFLEKAWRYFVVTTFVLSIAATSVCLNLVYSQTPQWQDYMQGRFLYTFTLQYSSALEAFTRSLQDYQTAMTVKDDPFRGRPSLEMAELALHFKALAEMKMGTEGKMKDALVDLNQALALTVKEELDLAELDGRLAPALRAKIEKDRLDDQVNVEILQNNKPKLAKGQGKGKGKPDDGEGEKSDDPAKPGGNSAGKPTREEL